MTATTLHLVRHGQSEWNVSRRLQGQTAHVPLTPLGHAQAGCAARALAGRDIVAVHTSDLVRARRTAEPVGAALDLPVQVDPALREQGYGVLEGLFSADVLAAAPYDFSDPDARAPGGESLREVYERIGACLSGYAARYRGGACVLVSHGDVIRIGAAWASGLGPHEIPWLDAPNGSVTSLTVPVVRRVR